jgi:hypothetical protein
VRARYYDPATAQWLTRDPLAAVTQAPYNYVDNNPLNNVDPMGLSTCGDFSLGGVIDCGSKAGHGAGHVANATAHAALDVAATVPYGVYYVNHGIASGINSVGDQFGTSGRIVSHIVALPFAADEALGLGGDAAIDWVKGHTVNNEKICDEGLRGYINPLHGYLPGPLKGPQVYLPGIHPNGDVDFEW